MASTREERLQMRQRGAGTHKTKAIDFGFSFGGEAGGSSILGPQAQLPVPVRSAQIENAPTVATSPSLQPNASVQRTPGSARNDLPGRPSPYDIPVEDDSDRMRSNKRRKIGPSTRKSTTPLRAPASDIVNANSEKDQLGLITKRSSDIPNASGESPLASRPGRRAQSQASDERSQLGERQDDLGIREVDKSPAGPSKNKPTSPDNTNLGPLEVSLREKQPVADLVDSSRSLPQRRRQSQSPLEATGPARKKPTRAASQKTRKSISPTAATSPERTDPGRIDTTTDGQVHQLSRQSSPTRVDSSRAAQHEHSPSARNEDPQPPRDLEIETTLEHDSVPPKGKSKNRRINRRSSPAQVIANSNGEEGVRNAEVAQPQTKEHVEPGVRAQKKRTQRKMSPSARKNKSQAETGRSKSFAETEPPEVSTASARTRRGNKKKDTRLSSEAPPGNTATQVPQASETDDNRRAEMEAGSSQAQPAPPKKRKGKRTTDAPTTDKGEQVESEVSDKPKRKARAPRGDTVPVTVHRLVNAAALGAPETTAEGSAEDASSRAHVKLPARGGVNAADVLGQICRETLEKTLEKLGAGIENEDNAQKRAEWSRKRKAVEEFGTELDNRLMDISEVLDSNFALATQLRKAKRDMMDLRNHLYQVRKEREIVAIQMDAVRAKHMEEENAQSARNTINNSLHSLDMALDRSQTRAESGDGTSSSDLEFMLRTVADNVSCRAPGAQGGLLNQIRAFNHQLEATARRLERS
ncbi:hypothetical protein PDE_05216 [Penicillium oxalicum 114-2]|uniref:Inner kinetochore subunit AME1 domain-containing protein n=1 Tax=Penicillium oxalicum (strain 114-2 / CGMCC 5302) TaxID=933388 RepID=S7ZHY3_PENO1|nr:hypothetical protein PDE_05216 [Penicillium oxalicum 114-2]